MSYKGTCYSAKKLVKEKLLLRELTPEEENIVDELIDEVWRDAISYDPHWDSE